MAEIRPFRAVIYNPEKIKDLSCVVCPPYDIISPSRQQHYHDLSPYNFIYILFGKDTTSEDKYRRAGNYFKDWQKNKIFIQDETPAIYFYSQQYNFKGERKTRLGFVALLYLGDQGPTVFAHEHTHFEPKEDRLKLLKTVKANLSPIFVLFADKQRIIQNCWQQYLQDKKPFIDIMDDEKIVHKLWRLDSTGVLEKIQAKMQDETIFIADGHHRYEVACAYRNQMQQKRETLTGQEGFNYILAYFTNVESRGLTILPIHRLVKLNSDFNSENFMVRLKDCFDIEEVKDRIRFFFLIEKAGQTEHLLGMYRHRRFWLLRLKNIKILDKMITDKPKEYRLLDIAILNYIVLKRALGFDFEDKEKINFSHNIDEIIEKVDNDVDSLAFFLNPAKIQQVISVALSGEKMPAKSTFFYPKVLSGLVINKFNEDKS